MAKETISQTEGLCKEVANCIRNAYDRGYKQGQKDMEQDTMAVLENGKMIGREEAWECAKKIALRKDEARNAFRDIAPVKVFEEYSASEAIAKIKEYEDKHSKKQTDEIKIGDEVIYLNDGDSSDGYKGIVIGFDGKGYYNVKLYKEWSSWAILLGTYLIKTGKHFDQIAEVLEQLKGEQDETNRKG